MDICFALRIQHFGLYRHYPGLHTLALLYGLHIPELFSELFELHTQRIGFLLLGKPFGQLALILWVAVHRPKGLGGCGYRPLLGGSSLWGGLWRRPYRFETSGSFQLGGTGYSFANSVPIRKKRVNIYISYWRIASGG